MRQSKNWISWCQFKRRRLQWKTRMYGEKKTEDGEPYKEGLLNHII